MEKPTGSVGGLSALLVVFEIPIECGTGGVSVGVQGDKTNVGCQTAQDVPSNKTNVQAEQPPFVSIHHVFGSVDGF